ncbi:dihydrofolate reductase [Ignicoccus pacificus DSM 13166]|uniref:Dihydrofolate reductase n=1 Tax=Ignicoccus pacificus DSM 13166 TaxID=940294 RepID=A0A977K930_9CREN|nr:dihydrofolate reductase [Ignicoccus pacificus DSM 13166]
MRFSLVGAGLRCEQVTEEAWEEIRKRKEVFVDVYTSLYPGGLLNCVKKVREDAKEAHRDLLEGDFLKGRNDVALVVPGDPFAATTHVSLYVEARKRGYDVKLIPGISALQVARTKSGLSQYRFGRVVTMMYPREGISFSESVYYAIKDNDSLNLHTIVLLETGYDRSMTAPEAAKLLIEEARRKGDPMDDRMVIVMARLCWDNEIIEAMTLKEASEGDFGPPPHLMVIPSPKLHPMEEEFLETLKSSKP